MRAKQRSGSHLLLALWLGTLCLLRSARGYQEEAGLECELPAWALAGNLSAPDYESAEAEQLPPAERLLGRRQALEAEARFESLLDYDAYRPPDFATPASPPDEDSFPARSRASEKESGPSSAPAQQPKSAPQFIKEPPGIIHYLNSSDLVIACSAGGNPSPTISWWHKNAQLELGSLLDRRYVRYDNSLVISAFKASDFEPDIHSTTYKCQAANALGTIVSRDVVINAVIEQDYEVSVADQFVTVDNDALFRCLLSPGMRHLFQVTGWLEDGQHLIQATSGAALGGRRTLVLADGQLHVQRVQLRDTNKSYRCQLKNLLSGQLSVSAVAGRLFVTDANEQSGVAPRIVDAPRPLSLGRPGEPHLLACLAQGSPRPTVRWLRQPAGQSDWAEVGVEASNQTRFSVAAEGNLLLVRALQLADQRTRFRCVANNTFGTHLAETELRLELWPANRLLELEPRTDYIRQGYLSTHQSVLLNCTVRASPSQPLVALEWLHNGRPLLALSAAGEQLVPQQQPPQPPLPGAYENSSARSLFDDPNQELSAIEFFPAGAASPNQDSASSNNIEESEPEAGRFLAAPTSLAKLEAGWESGGRLRQRARLLSRDTLLYQLQVDQVRRSDRGAYQCRARSPRETQQVSGQLLLRDSPPHFVDTFAGQLVARPGAGASVSLRCAASGSPLPEISWTLSGFPVPESSRFRVGDYVTRDGLIVSFVNISNVQFEDGGLFECLAANEVGQLHHSQWLNVTGPPFVRPMANVSAVAGHTLLLMCPVGGWPIEQIGWFQNSTKLPANHRQKLFPNGTLLVSELNEVTDSGQYSCQARAGDLLAANQLQVSIKVPPVVEPFAFSKSLHRGQRYNIMCTVVRGDLPVAIRWFKDGRPLAESGGEALAIRQLEPYSSTLTFGSLQSQHRGLYNCEATNEAGRDNQSSALVIHVPPEWRIEPRDMSVTVGRTAVIDCQADAFPAARIEWRLSQDLFREPPSEFRPIISSLYMRVFENGSLIIYNSQRTDAGFYLCQASNGVGPGLSRVVKLTVHVAAHFKTKIRTELVRRGQAARLRCEAIGDPPLEINWLRDKMPLYAADEPRYALTRTQLPDGLLSELSLLEAERQDSALFTCIAQNQFGNDDTNIQLVVQAPPEPPAEIRIQEYEARSVRISWQAAHSGNSPLLRYVVTFSEASGAQFANATAGPNDTSLLLSNLTPLTEYQFFMFAVNALGSSRTPSEPVKFRTDDEAPAGPPLFVKAAAASARSVRVRWRPPERRAHYGATAGFYVGYKVAGARPTAAAGRDTFVYKTVEFADAANRSAGVPPEQEAVLQALRRATKYLVTVQAFNARGAGPASEPVLVETWRVDVPEPPSLRMVLRSTHALHLAWRLAAPERPPAKARRAHQPEEESEEAADEALQAAEPITGFLLARRQLTPSSATEFEGAAVETRLPADHLSHIVERLACGTRYQFTLQAINAVGPSLPSDPLLAKTEGSPPVAPDKSSLLSVNGSAALINLAAWHNGQCPMRAFDIMFKPSRSKKWTSVSQFEVLPSGASVAGPPADHPTAQANLSALPSAEQPSQLVQRSTYGHLQRQQLQLSSNSTVLLTDLGQALNYDLRIVATNEAGPTEREYTFNTWPGRDESGEFQLADAGLSELLAHSNPTLTGLLLVILLCLALSAGCILLARRRHASSSSCSLSLSSASRSNQSSSNYYTAAAQQAQLDSVKLGQRVCGTLHKVPEDSPIQLVGQHQAPQQLDLSQAPRAERPGYAFLTSRAASPPHPDLAGSVINGSEAEMCLGASALNIALANQQEEAAAKQRDSQPAYYMAALAGKSAGPQIASKSSTLPANCHQQIVLQQLLSQQQPQESDQLGNLVAANILQQQPQCHTDYQSANELGMALLDQQLQQQVYATVKRGCPRPPRLCDYTIYQCPGSQDPEQRQQLSMLRCCNNLAAGSQQPVCYHPEQMCMQQQQVQQVQQQQQQMQQQQQASDYQQLRPIN